MKNISDAIDYAVGHDTVFHQFMLYTPNPGTPLYEEHKRAGTLLDQSEFPLADAHGQYRFNYRHRNIQPGKEQSFLVEAFDRDFKTNGPSLFRLIRTLLNGWKRYKNHQEKRISDRLAWEASPLKTTYAGALWAMRKWYRNDSACAEKSKIL